MWKDVVTNFDKQKLRMERQIGLSGNKLSKKNDFAPAAEKLLLTGGNDKLNLICDGNKTNEGAAQLKNLSTVLSLCNTEVAKTCDTSTWSQPDTTKLETCEKLTKEFIAASQACLDKTNQANKTDTCSCWEASALNKTVQAVKDCKFSSEARNIATAKEKCLESFRKCRKYEDASITVISACKIGYAELTKKVR